MRHLAWLRDLLRTARGKRSSTCSRAASAALKGYASPTSMPEAAHSGSKRFPAALRMFLQHMKAAEWAIIAESGHSAYWERPECFNAAVLAFLRKH